jgi:hypothetical protein
VLVLTYHNSGSVLRSCFMTELLSAFTSLFKYYNPVYRFRTFVSYFDICCTF